MDFWGDLRERNFLEITRRAFGGLFGGGGVAGRGFCDFVGVGTEGEGVLGAGARFAGFGGHGCDCNYALAIEIEARKRHSMVEM